MTVAPRADDLRAARPDPGRADSATASLRAASSGRALALAELTRRATSLEPAESTIAFALHHLRTMLRADAVSFWDQPQPNRLRLALAEGWPVPVDGVIIPVAPDSQAAFVLASDSAVLADLHGDTRFVPSSLLRDFGYVISIGSRVGTPEAPRGIVSIAWRGARDVGEDECAIVDACSGVIALALEYRRSQDDLRFRAEHDTLTGLANRATLLDTLDAVAGASPGASALLIDLDGFKTVNDAKGHAAGDEVLQVVARRLQETVRAGDLVARLGGDEFVIVARRADVSAARVLAERVIGAIEQLITVGEHSVSVSASIGIADCGRHLAARDIIQAADKAMYDAKASGRGRVSAAAASGPASRRPGAPAPRAEPAVTADLDVASIDAAIERTTVAFQPIVTAAGHRIVGVEALARGPVGSPFELPAAFFAAAETFSRLRELDLAAKRAAFAAKVPDDLALFLNVDPSVLTDDHFRQQLIDTWRASGFGGEVVVELTERSLVAAPGRLLRAIDGCREAGWRIALDDLGARAETLTAMRLVRPDVAKLDMSLVDARNASHAAAVAVAVHTHRERWPLTIVAEGVETEEHERVARDLGADLLQGYRFGRPAPLDAVLTSAPWGAGLTLAAADERVVMATKRHLLDVTRVIESMALGAESIVLCSLQAADYYTARTRRQYAALARRCGMAGVVGVGLPPGVVAGVHHAPIPPDDALARAWQVVVLSANGGIALLAEDSGHRGVSDSARMFHYCVTRDPETVEAAAHRLLAYF